LSVQEDDGYWRLGFHDFAGDRIAVSADRFTDARTSRLELDRICRAVDAALMRASATLRREPRAPSRSG
jgi:hypothetical protein